MLSSATRVLLNTPFLGRAACLNFFNPVCSCSSEHREQQHAGQRGKALYCLPLYKTKLAAVAGMRRFKPSGFALKSSLPDTRESASPVTR